MFDSNINDDSLDFECTIKHDKASSKGTIDQYELLSELGGGGFGTVYLAKDTVSGIKVAVKGLPPLIKNNKEELENIRRNFALVSRLTHENIAKALVLHPVKTVTYTEKRTEENLRVQSGDTLMVMDYASGVTLSSWRKQFPENKVPLDKTIEIARQIASALDYAHSQRIIHRDIKPSNIMIDSRADGSIMVSVLDFGLAAEIRSSMGRVSMMVTDMSGSRPYMAPEQWQGRKQAGETDQYALAAMIYELLTGDVPFASVFSSGDPMLMKNVVVNESPEILSELPKPVWNALRKALSKNREDRFPNCLDFVEALEGKKVSRGMPIRASAIFAVVALACAAGGGVWCWQKKLQKDFEDRRNRRIEGERYAYEGLKSAATELKIRATQAYEDARDRGYGEMPELSNLYREFNRHYRVGMEFFSLTNYVAATNAFSKVGISMKALVAEKKRLDEELARVAEEKRKMEEKERRKAQLEHLASLGYVINGDEAVWKEGVPHKTNRILVTDSVPETWKAVKTGWKWNGGNSAIWQSGVEHPKYRNWVSSASPEKWSMKKGYRPQGEVDEGLPKLVWTPGLRYGEYRTSQLEGVWERLANCNGCYGRGQKESRVACGTCNGSANVSYEMRCNACSGSGRFAIRERCGSCTGGYVTGNCTSGCNQLMRGGQIVVNRGFVCPDCNGNGYKSNVGGIRGNILGAGVAAALGGGRRYRGYQPPPPPARVQCMRCSGAGVLMCANCSGTGQVRSRCSRCGGAGTVSSSRNCVTCNGSGKVSRMQTCGSCIGGYVSSPSSCSDCNGGGKIWRECSGGPVFDNPVDIATATEKAL